MPAACVCVMSSSLQGSQSSGLRTRDAFRGRKFWGRNWKKFYLWHCTETLFFFFFTYCTGWSHLSLQARNNCTCSSRQNWVLKPRSEQIQNRPEKMSRNGRVFPCCVLRERKIDTVREGSGQRNMKWHPLSKEITFSKVLRSVFILRSLGTARLKKVDLQQDPWDTDSAFEKVIRKPIYTSIRYDVGSRIVNRNDFAEVLGNILYGMCILTQGSRGLTLL